MKYFIIAGEPSGDNYGALLMDALTLEDNKAEFQFVGGPKMKAESPNQLISIEDTAFMGFWEVLKNIFNIKQLFKSVKKSILEFKPDTLILIDYPGFNLRIVNWAYDQGIKITYYVSPQLWAWKKNRYKILRDKVDLFFVILPFEKKFFEQLNTPCQYFGHPLTELIPQQNKNLKEVKQVGLFPGSRAQEVEKHLKIFSELAHFYPQYEFTVAGLSHISEAIYRKHLKQSGKNLKLVFDDPYQIMEESDVAITSSGTATLELVLFETPQIVVYATSQLSYLIGKNLIGLKYISLVNLILDKSVVTELIQQELNLANLKNKFEEILDISQREKMITAYRKIRKLLGDNHVSEKVAKNIYQYCNDQVT
ncbi:MAG: lipid-A-disaccharide synthase [Saprospiraceae bacterium]|nr:lipid-A-disaccharide synthase [Saprospiraceae bacterium]